MSFRDADIQPILDDLGGVLVTIAGVSARCHVDVSDEKIANSASSSLVGRAITATAKTGTFSGAAQSASATVESGVEPNVGGSYAVVRVQREGDFDMILLAKV